MDHIFKLWIHTLLAHLLMLVSLLFLPSSLPFGISLSASPISLSTVASSTGSGLVGPQIMTTKRPVVRMKLLNKEDLRRLTTGTWPVGL